MRYTYKGFVRTSMSRSSIVLVETGMLPRSLLSAKSNQYKLDKFPIEGGISPLNKLEFRDLHLECEKPLVGIYRKL